jgi:hypothetical protein
VRGEAASLLRMACSVAIGFVVASAPFYAAVSGVG